MFHYELTAHKLYPPPSHSLRDVISESCHNFEMLQVQLIRGNRVVVISGETGCGKTTQVPIPMILLWAI